MFRSSISIAKTAIKARSASATRSYTNWPFLKEEHIMIQETARNFADSELAPIAGSVDKAHEFPMDVIMKIGELG